MQADSDGTAQHSLEDRRALGAEGETRAVRFLARRGYRIVARNVRAGGVEMDIVARRGSLVVFVEVKTRRSTRFGAPELAVDAAKRARLLRGAAAWLHDHGHTLRARELRIRFDVIAWRVSGGGGRRSWRIEHLKAAFDAGD